MRVTGSAGTISIPRAPLQTKEYLGKHQYESYVNVISWVAMIRRGKHDPVLLTDFASSLHVSKQRVIYSAEANPCVTPN